MVENRTGAGGTDRHGLCRQTVDPDGYTILVHSAAFAIQAATFPNIGYDFGKDFAGVTLIGHAPLVMIASPAKYEIAEGACGRRQVEADYGELFHGRLWRGGAIWPRSGWRSPPEASRRSEFRSAARRRPSTRCWAERVDFFFSPTLAAVPLIRAGKLVALATSGSKRAQSLPDVPTTIEAGYPNSAYNFWIGMWVPVKTPRDVVEKLYQETRKALDLKEVQEQAHGARQRAGADDCLRNSTRSSTTTSR